MTAVAPVRRPPVAVGVVLIVVGALVVAGTLAVTALQWAFAQPVTTGSRTVELSDIATDMSTHLRVTSSAADLSIEYGPSTEAELVVTGPGGASGWTLARDGDGVVVTAPHRTGFTWPFGNSGSATAVLTLPYSMETAAYDADITLAAGGLRLSGDYRALTIEQDAGTAHVAVSAQTLGVELNAGAFSGTVSGDQPGSVTADVSAGSLSLRLPQGSYHVTSDVSAGDFSNHLPLDPSSPSRVRVSVSAGSATLRADS